MELFSQSFWVLTFVFAVGLIGAYFVLRQAWLDALTEWSRRERERDKQERERRGGFKP